MLLRPRTAQQFIIIKHIIRFGYNWMGTCCTMLMSEYQLTEKAAAWQVRHI